MTGPELYTFGTSVNGSEPIDTTLYFQFVNIARAMVQRLRPWMILHKTDTSKTVSASSANAWQTAIDLSTITDFDRFYGEHPVKLFDGTASFLSYKQVPWDQRLSYFQVPGTFVYNEATKALYLNGSIPFSGTLYIDYLYDPGDITNSDSSTWVFPSWSHPLLGYLGVGAYKGGVDFDEVSARMAPDNRASAQQIIQMLENWDNEKQLGASQGVDYANEATDAWPRPNSINIHS
jgi:hypothetical protein